MQCTVTLTGFIFTRFVFIHSRGRVRNFTLRVSLLNSWFTLERVPLNESQNFTGSAEPVEPVLTRPLHYYTDVFDNKVDIELPSGLACPNIVKLLYLCLIFKIITMEIKHSKFRMYLTIRRHNTALLIDRGLIFIP